jgi:hypothetical protein
VPDVTPDEPNDTNDTARTIFQRATVACIRLYQQTQAGVPQSEELREAVEGVEKLLVRIWTALAREYAARAAGWSTDAANPGYLLCETAVGHVKVPYHLATDFPREPLLGGLTELAFRIRTSGGSAICVSGSSTFWEALEVVADVDFCEYTPVSGTTDAQAEFRKRLFDASCIKCDDLFCTKAKANDHTRAEIPLAGTDPTPIFRAKLDFIALLASEVVEATNVVLPVRNGDSQDPVLQESFPQQEAPVADGAWVPQALLAPLSIGRYADWLRREVTDKIDSLPVKAAKRALALARLAGYANHGERLIAALRVGTELVEAAVEARRALLPNLDVLASDPPRREAFRTALAVTVTRLEAEIATRRATLDAGDRSAQTKPLEGLKDAMRCLLDDIARALGEEEVSA